MEDKSYSVTGDKNQVVQGEGNQVTQQNQKEVAEKFVEDPSILAVVGHNSSIATIPAKEIYKNKLVMITPTSFSDKIQGDSYIFRMVPQISYFANKLAIYIKEENPNSIVGTCNDPSSPDNDSFIAQFEAIFNKNKNVFKLTCDFLDKKLDDNSMEQAQAVEKVLKEIKQNKINSLVVTPYVDRIPAIINIVKNIHSNNPSIRLYGSPTFFRKITLEEREFDGLTLSVPWYPHKNDPKNIIQFQQKFEQLYQASTNNWRTLIAYDSTWIIATGLEQILRQEQDINREQLNKALQGEFYSEKRSYPKFTYDGATGTTTFSSGGVNENQADIIIKIKNGQFVPISKQ